MTTVSREGQTFRGVSVLARYASLVKLPHTVFALPFALLGMLAAARVAPLTGRTVALIVVAFSAARFAAMGFNRIADRTWDARNPRTRDREIPAGRISVRAASIAVTVASLIFVTAAALLHTICLVLSPIALAWILGYSYAKRFTNWPHLWLGLSLAIAPVGGWLAVTGRWSEPWWLLIAITVAVVTWVAGFDVFYALPDEGFDRDAGLHSAVLRLGQRRAILLAKLLHGITIPALALFGLGAGFGLWYFAGVGAAAIILLYEHRLVRPGDLSRLDAAFFTMNGVMSMTVFAFALIDHLVGAA
ncbi:MAG TPA: UbiA-like polyprenyltransferase [Gemmatimonadales bacterium]|nr:UbiA-like polyprenyltransferase [Gemmatimonadales bacterium]